MRLAGTQIYKRVLELAQVRALVVLRSTAKLYRIKHKEYRNLHNPGLRRDLGFEQALKFGKVYEIPGISESDLMPRTCEGNRAFEELEVANPRVLESPHKIG